MAAKGRRTDPDGKQAGADTAAGRATLALASREKVQQGQI